MRMASPSMSTGSKAWIERRCSVGARLSSTGWPLVTSSRMSQTSGVFFSIIFLAPRDGVHEAEFLEAADDERLEQDERHLLRQTALVELELRTDDDDGTAGVIDALAEQVLAETALLALEHVGERLQRTVAGAGDGAAMAAVVEERVDGFLQHALFVADDDVRRLELQQVLQTVVAVDDAAIEIVEIGGREAAALERHERTQVRRDDRQHFEDHPLRTGLGSG